MFFDDYFYGTDEYLLKALYNGIMLRLAEQQSSIHGCF
ncbi:hypothetical protein C900_00042 [Fulvivirga imtechensis AK7]|uniref:Uncharacterized protein n=1 Tax=Fulvivirga imtechensis AK7 TaxID=1237149 RepID=L8K0F2_9BACT|nr:hypothetical protein C900_00042 [Fulvivirga imtechensis AK7]